MSVTFPLNLRWTKTPVMPAAAWLIAGGDAARWIEEIAAWNVPMADLKLLPLSASLRDRKPVAVLVVPLANLITSISPTPLASPYGVLAGRLFLPIDSVLDPDVSTAELSSTLLNDFQILHPSIGLVGFSESEILRVRDLIAPPRAIDVKWDRAVEGVTTAPRLLSIQIDATPTLQSIMRSAQDDIGTKAPAKETPPVRKPSLKDTMAKINRPMLRVMEWLAKHTPTIPMSPGWIDALGHWASARLGAVNEKLSDARNAELNRLVEMMDKDPDQGLQFAIPLGFSASRGIAPPSSTLSQRPADFNLSRLRGSGAADPWEVSWQIRQKLLQQYRAAANRELALGRHRRAAYIFAELLGDFSSAASALRQGKHFRDAAALYRDNLNNLRAAAECLEEGGQLLEATAIYESQKLWLKAGDVYTRIERGTDATRCWRQAVRENLDRREYLAAAGLLETRLSEPDEALKVLTDAWPESEACLGESFELLGRLGRHDQANHRVASLLKDRVAPERIVPLAQALSAVAKLYPSTAVRDSAADATRVICGNRLPVADRAEVSALVQAVTRLAPEDRLLSRDGNRFIARVTEQRPKPYPMAKPTGKEVRPVANFALAGVKSCTLAKPSDGLFYALGYLDNGRQCIIRGNWAGQSQVFDGISGIRNFFPMSGKIPRQIVLLSEGGIISDKELPAFPASPVAAACPIGKPAWMPLYVHGMSFSEQSVAWIATKIDPGVNGYELPTGRLLSRYAIELESLENLSIAAVKDMVFLASGHKLLQISEKGTISTIDLPSPARQIIASPAFTRARVVVTLEEGALIIWPSEQHQLIGQGLADPVATFLSDGRLILLASNGGRIFRARDGRVECVASLAAMGAEPIAVMPTLRAGEYAVITSNAQVRTYQADLG